MLAADQVIGSMVKISGSHQKIHDVGFTVGHVDLPGLRQLPGALGHPLVSFDPALAFLDVVTLAIGGLGLSGPHPRIHHTQWLTGRAHGMGLGMLPLGSGAGRSASSTARSLRRSLPRSTVPNSSCAPLMALSHRGITVNHGNQP